MTHLTTNNKHLYAVAVPLDAKEIRIVSNTFFSNLFYEGFDTITAIDLGLGDYTILGTVTQSEIDFDCSGLVGILRNGSRWNLFKISEYVDYIEPHKRMYNASDSFRSFLAANGVVIKEGEKVLIIEKK